MVKLSLDLNCLAYGSQDGVLRMIFFNQMATEPSDAVVREAQQHSVTALEWNKYRLFSGFSSGKVLMTTVKINKVTTYPFQQEVLDLFIYSILLCLFQ